MKANLRDPATKQVAKHTRAHIVLWQSTHGARLCPNSAGAAHLSKPRHALPERGGVFSARAGPVKGSTLSDDRSRRCHSGAPRFRTIQVYAKDRSIQVWQVGGRYPPRNEWGAPWTTGPAIRPGVRTLWLWCSIQSCFSSSCCSGSMFRLSPAPAPLFAAGASTRFRVG
jgi:hypothetical protein